MAALFASADLKPLPYREFGKERQIAREPVQDRAPEKRCDPGDGVEALQPPAAAVRASAFAERIPGRRNVQSLFTLKEEPEAGARLEERAEAVMPSVLSASPAPDPLETTQAVEAYARAVKMQTAPASGSDKGKSSAVDNAVENAESGLDVSSEHGQSHPDGELKSHPAEQRPSWLTRHEEALGQGEWRALMRETLAHSRETVARRWFALRGIFGEAEADADTTSGEITPPSVPLLAIYSVAGGVGKTSLAAAITRGLAAQGERVLLVDLTDRDILPFYLGARELRRAVMRIFAPPAGSTDQPIHLVSYRTDAPPAEKHAEDLAARIQRDGSTYSRVVVDVASADVGTLEALFAAGARALIAVTPDMNSILSVPALQRTLKKLASSLGQDAPSSFLLSQFDTAQPLQLDIRAILQQQLGDQLLPFVIRRSPAIAEALAEGMTVIDYAPGEGIAKDYLQVAAWMRSLTKPARLSLAQARWSEQ